MRAIYQYCMPEQSSRQEKLTLTNNKISAQKVHEWKLEKANSQPIENKLNSVIIDNTGDYYLYENLPQWSHC